MRLPLTLVPVAIAPVVLKALPSLVLTLLLVRTLLLLSLRLTTHALAEHYLVPTVFQLQGQPHPALTGGLTLGEHVLLLLVRGLTLIGLAEVR